MSSRVVSSTPRPTPTLATLLKHTQIRHRLLIGCAVLCGLAVWNIGQVGSAYSAAYHLTQGIVEQNSVEVDSSEQALEHIANVSTNAADYISTGSSQSLAAVYAELQKFRDVMFKLRAGLDSSGETSYVLAEAAAYNQFWPQISLAIAARQSGDQGAAVNAYVAADKSLEADLVTNLQKLETANFEVMKHTEQASESQIFDSVLMAGGSLLLLSAALTWLSFWMRRRLRRIITPGLDLALVLSWVLLIGMANQLLNLQGQMHLMVEDAYDSVTASSRVLAIANQGNRAESGALLDLTHIKRWQQEFDMSHRLVELRMCGAPDCLNHSFVTSGDRLDWYVVNMAQNISKADSVAIDGIVPLLANVTFPGEAQTLEKARLAYLDYLKIDGTTRQLIVQNRIGEAIALNTGTGQGQSDEAYGRFSAAMQDERAINRAVFDKTWQLISEGLQTNRVLYGALGYALVIGLLILGIAQRYREW